MSNDQDKVQLTGGNVSSVYRIGNTVRRGLKPKSHKIHALLKHLESKGFNEAPQFLGVDIDGALNLIHNQITKTKLSNSARLPSEM